MADTAVTRSSVLCTCLVANILKLSLLDDEIAAFRLAKPGAIAYRRSGRWSPERAWQCRAPRLSIRRTIATTSISVSLISDALKQVHGGGRGIRTPVTRKGKAVFKTACFNHSHIPPHFARGAQTVYNAAHKGRSETERPLWCSEQRRLELQAGSELELPHVRRACSAHGRVNAGD